MAKGLNIFFLYINLEKILPNLKNKSEDNNDKLK